jgi:hypothetical protein
MNNYRNISVVWVAAFLLSGSTLYASDKKSSPVTPKWVDGEGGNNGFIVSLNLKANVGEQPEPTEGGELATEGWTDGFVEFFRADDGACGASLKGDVSSEDGLKADPIQGFGFTEFTWVQPKTDFNALVGALVESDSRFEEVNAGGRLQVGLSIDAIRDLEGIDIALDLRTEYLNNISTELRKEAFGDQSGSFFRNQARGQLGYIWDIGAGGRALQFNLVGTWTDQSDAPDAQQINTGGSELMHYLTGVDYWFSKKVLGVSGIYLSYEDGELPNQAAGDTAWKLGVHIF